MDINAAYPSQYLKASDLMGQEIPVTMRTVQMEDIGGDPKPVMYFEGKEKGMVLNKTNANNISDAYGYETNNWFGKQIILFEARVDFQGRTVPAIRVRVPNGQAAQNAQAPVQNSTPPKQSEPVDEIPF